MRAAAGGILLWILVQLSCVLPSLEGFVLGPSRNSLFGRSFVAATRDGVTNKPVNLLGLEQIVDRYDSFIIDQWGVLHDGRNAYPKVLEALCKLKEKGKMLVLLSNSSKRAANGLVKVGIPDSIFGDNIVTSGLVTFDLLRSGGIRNIFPELSGSNIPLKIFVFGNSEDDEEFVNQSGSYFTTSVEKCNLLLCRGTFSIGKKCFGNAFDLFDHPETEITLNKCAVNHIPMLVSNPDFYRPGSGAPMPGLLAKRYCDKGQEAKIHQVGKPFPAVFEECFKIIRNKRRDNSLPPISLDRICMIGDSIEHDVLGANNMGIDSVFIQAGVHSNELQISEASPIPPSEQVFEDFLGKHKATPTYIIPCFTF